MAAVTENKTANVDMNHPSVEIIQFTTAASGDTYDSIKFSRVTNAWASQSTTDGQDLQISFANQANGQPRITITTESEAVVTGFLVIEGVL